MYKSKVWVIIGAPNSGKSSVIRCLTGIRLSGYWDIKINSQSSQTAQVKKFHVQICSPQEENVLIKPERKKRKRTPKEFAQFLKGKIDEGCKDILCAVQDTSPKDEYIQELKNTFEEIEVNNIPNPHGHKPVANDLASQIRKKWNWI